VSNATIFAVKRFAVHDGDGIRTTVFFKGCPLSCLWCHNPEGKAFMPQLAYYSHKCINCGECVAVCPNKAHNIDENGHRFDSNKCVACGKCVEGCLGDALALYGESVTAEELLKRVMEDRDFYTTSGGGVTFSGGECLSQVDFCLELGRMIKKENVNLAIDTCGFVPRNAIKKICEVADIFLYDIKAFSEETHIKCTGCSNKLIWDNLEYINSQNKAVDIRIPLVPGFNDGEIESIARRLSELKCIRLVDVLPYHDLSKSKYDALNGINTMPKTDIPTRDMLNTAVATLKQYNLNARCSSLK